MSVGPDDFGWFSPADFRFVVSNLSGRQGADHFIIVGGQSLVAWTLYYGIEIPATATPYLTQDLDLIGIGKDAQWLARQIDAEIHLADIERATANTAVLIVPSRDGRSRLIIDVLNGVLGVPDEEVRHLAVEMTLADHPDFRDLPTFKVLHPLLCLKSRVENLDKLPEKRGTNGITQAMVAIQVAKHFFLEQIENGQLRTAGRAAARIADIASSSAGLFCFEQFGIDVLSSVDATKNPCRLWRELDWPRRTEWVEKKRRMARARLARNGQ